MTTQNINYTPNPASSGTTSVNSAVLTYFHASCIFQDSCQIVSDCSDSTSVVTGKTCTMAVDASDSKKVNTVIQYDQADTNATVYMMLYKAAPVATNIFCQTAIEFEYDCALHTADLSTDLIQDYLYNAPVNLGASFGPNNVALAWIDNLYPLHCLVQNCKMLDAGTLATISDLSLSSLGSYDMAVVSNFVGNMTVHISCDVKNAIAPYSLLTSKSNDFDVVINTCMAAFDA
jgi:hypothetical protein